MTYKLTQKLSLTGGFRYTFDQDKLSGVQTAFLDSYRGNPVALSIPPGPYDPNAFYPTTKKPTEGATYRANLQYEIAPRQMAYASFSHGYRAGNFKGSQFFSPEEVYFVKPEKVDTYEVGLKGSFWARVLTVEIAAFYNDLHGQQVASQVLGADGTFIAGLDSLNGKSYGVELEAQLNLSSSLRVSGNASLMHTRYASGQFINITDPVGGNRFPLAPKFSGLVQVDWTPWRSGNRSVTLTGSANYMGQYYYDPQNGNAGGGRYFVNGQKSYTLVDARLSYDVGKISLSAWVKNLTDRFYLPFAATAGDNDAVQPGMPRTFGVQARFGF